MVKIDHTINAKDSVWYRFQQDTGLQAAYTDPINPIFNSYSPQPQRTLVAGYTHVFSPKLVNQFNPGASWYSSIFEPNNYSQVQQTFPIVLASGSDSVPFTTIGGNNNTYPQGRKVTQWQINDNLTWTRGKHTEVRHQHSASRREQLRSRRRHGTHCHLQRSRQFTYGAAYTASQSFPCRSKRESPQAISNTTRWTPTSPRPRRPSPTACASPGTPNVTSQQESFRSHSRIISRTPRTTRNQPLNQLVLGNVHDLFPATPLFV